MKVGRNVTIAPIFQLQMPESANPSQNFKKPAKICGPCPCLFYALLVVMVRRRAWSASPYLCVLPSLH